MHNTAPPARYDSPWKAALTHALRAFISFFFADLSAQINWSKRPRFRDKELAGISFSDKPDGKLADNDARWRPHSFRREAPGTATTFAFATAKLLDYADQTDALMKSNNPFALVTLAHLRTQQARRDPDALYAAKWQLTELLYQHGWRKERIIIFFKVINWMMALPKPHQERYWRALRHLEKERKMEWISPLEQSFMDKGWERGLKKGLKQGLEQGLQQGREHGLEQGRNEGARALLERLLVRRFGPLPKTAHSKLAKASLAQLEAWSDALAEAESLKQVFVK